MPSEYLHAVKARGLLLPSNEEVNWSGRGQHVEYERGEEVPLQVISRIGMSLKAVVDKVRCRRILLTRKTMTCSRRLSLHQAFSEVEHLQKLEHAHVIQLVGSYLQGKKFSVLLYPVADYDLGAFLDEVLLATSKSTLSNENSVIALWNSFGCLVQALGYLHSKHTKHLDIKPGNILIKKHQDYENGHRFYIADFGISRSFRATDHSQTDTLILGTPKYYAPEVWNGESHGRAADYFSLGCVFMEMFTVLCGIDLEEFLDFRTQGLEEMVAYRNNLEKVIKWGRQLNRQALEIILANPQQINHRNIWLLEMIKDMLAEDPQKRRPFFSLFASELDLEIGCRWCCATREVYREES